MMEVKKKVFKFIFIIVLLPIFCAYLMFFHYTNINEVGIKYNLVTGDLSTDINAGLHFSEPWVFVTKINERPHRVCITSTTKTIHCKLVEFNRKGYYDFVNREGFYYYWWSNRLSFNFGYSEEYRGIRDKLRGYAFAEKEYSFITILESFHE